MNVDQDRILILRSKARRKKGDYKGALGDLKIVWHTGGKKDLNLQR